MSTRPALIRRATDAGVNRATTLAAVLRDLDLGAVVGDYEQYVVAAPSRGADGHAYFVHRAGAPSSGTPTNRREEHLAMALANEGASLAAGAETANVLAYAFPLFSSGPSAGVRGVDLVGHSSDTERFWVIELKVAQSAGRGDSPLRALFEVLIYSAVVEANQDYISRELGDRYGRTWSQRRPGMVVAAPSAYWKRWAPSRRTGDWWSEFARAVGELSARFETPIAILDIGDVDFESGVGARPHLRGQVECRRVSY